MTRITAEKLLRKYHGRTSQKSPEVILSEDYSDHKTYEMDEQICDLESLRILYERSLIEGRLR